MEITITFQWKRWCVIVKSISFQFKKLYYLSTSDGKLSLVKKANIYTYKHIHHNLKNCYKVKKQACLTLYSKQKAQAYTTTSYATWWFA